VLSELAKEILLDLFRRRGNLITDRAAVSSLPAVDTGVGVQLLGLARGELRDLVEGVAPLPRAGRNRGEQVEEDRREQREQDQGPNAYILTLLTGSS
jgi:hypothetical protein